MRSRAGSLPIESYRYTLPKSKTALRIRGQRRGPSLPRRHEARQESFHRERTGGSSDPRWERLCPRTHAACVDGGDDLVWAEAGASSDRHFLGAQEAGNVIQECLDGLSAIQREVFQLRQVEELSAAEVCKISGHTITHIGVLFHRARMKLRECLEGKGWGRSR